MQIFDASMHPQFLKGCKKVYKKEYQVTIVRPTQSVAVTNFLEGAKYTTKPGDVVIKGTVGEQWVAPFAKVIKTYTHLDGSPLTEQSVS